MPENPIALSQIVIMSFLWIGLSATILNFSIIVLPSQIALFVGEGMKGKVLGLLISLNAVISLIISPIIGNISDKYNLFNFGKRKPYILIGIIILCISIIFMAFTSLKFKKNQTNNQQCFFDLLIKRCVPYMDHDSLSHLVGGNHTIFQLKSSSLNRSINYPNFIFFCLSSLLTTLSYIIITVPYNGMMADLIPKSQRGVASGIIGAVILLGNFIGAIIGFFLTNSGILTLYLTLCFMIIVTSSITLIFTTEQTKLTNEHNYSSNNTTNQNKFSEFLTFFDPLKDNDFFWVFFTRFLMQMAISTFTGFLEFWLSDMVDLPFCWSVEIALSFLLIPLLFFAGLFSTIGGYISDKMKKRKILLKLSSYLMAVCSLSLITIRGKYAYFVGIFMIITFGIGFGSFSAIDYALVMDVVPSKENLAKDLALWHQASVIAQLLSTPLGGFILDYFQKVNCSIGLGYMVLFGLVSIYFLLCGCFVDKIKKSY